MSYDRRRSSVPGRRRRVGSRFSGDGRIWLCCAVLCSVAFLNLNGIAMHVLSVPQLLSPIILLASLAALSWCRFRLMSLSDLLAQFYCIFLVSYLLIGSFAAAVHYGTEGLAKIGWNSGSVCASILVVFAFRQLTIHFRRLGRLHILFVLLLIVSSASSLTVVLSWVFPELGDMMVKPSARGTGRASGFFSDPNQAGMQCCITAVFCGALLCSIDKFRTSHVRGGLVIFAIGALFVAGVATFLTFSRSSMIVFFVVIAAGVLLYSSSQTIGKRLLVLVSGLALCTTMFYALTSYATGDSLDINLQQRLSIFSKLRSGEEFNEDDVGKRGSLVSKAVEYWMLSPLVGHGLGAAVPLPGIGLGPHNTFLRVAVESGVIPFAMMLVFLSVLVWKTIRASANVTQLIVGCYTLIFVGISAASHTVLDDRNHNVMLGLCLGLLVPRSIALQASRTSGETQDGF
jgi:O-antigen ligase